MSHRSRFWGFCFAALLTACASNSGGGGGGGTYLPVQDAGATPLCGDGVCELGENYGNCPKDCPVPASCGDGVCETNENAINCNGDCTCTPADSFCDPDGASLHFCVASTGKLTLEGCASTCTAAGKTFTKCDVDPAQNNESFCFCKMCGDGKCSFGESYANCPQDCPCTAADSTCTGVNSLNFCDPATGKISAQTCSDANCAAAGFGASTGCGTNSTGTTSCTCKKLGCGDGICEGNETSVSCPADCQGCATNANCPADSVCLTTVSQCGPLDGAKYVIEFESATFPATNNGSSWDGDGSAPDPYAQLLIGGSVVCKTSVVQDTYTPSWNASCPAVTIDANSKVGIAVYDSDLVVDDLADAATWPDFTSVLKAGSYSGFVSTNKTVTIKFTVTAQ